MIWWRRRGWLGSSYVRTPERIAADAAALDWFVGFVAAADPILAEHAWEIEDRRPENGWAHWWKPKQEHFLTLRIASDRRGEVWAQLEAHDRQRAIDISPKLVERLTALGARWQRCWCSADEVCGFCTNWGWF